MIIRSIEDLKDWQTDRDEILVEELVDSAEVLHPEFNFSPRALKLVAAQHTGSCELCGEAEFTIRDALTGMTSSTCRQCVNAVRRQTLTHVIYPAEICWDCTITKDSLGLINGAFHHTFPFDDELQKDGTIRRGLNPLILAGRIELVDNVLTLLPE